MYGDSSYFDILSASFSKSFLTSLLILSMIFFNALVQSGNHPGVLVSADSSFNIVAISAKCLPVMYTDARSICCCNGLMSECLRQFNRFGPDGPCSSSFGGWSTHCRVKGRQRLERGPGNPEHVA